MLTDALPRNRNQAEFLKSDRTKTLDLPQNGALPDIAQRLESAMKASAAPDVRKTCAEFLAVASDFYKVPSCGIRVLAGKTTASTRKLVYRTLWGLPSRNNADSRLDADSSAQRRDFVWYILEHVVSRILSSSRFSTFPFP
jgi:hypothetical protein